MIYKYCIHHPIIIIIIIINIIINLYTFEIVI